MSRIDPEPEFTLTMEVRRYGEGEFGTALVLRRGMSLDRFEAMPEEAVRMVGDELMRRGVVHPQCRFCDEMGHVVDVCPERRHLATTHLVLAESSGSFHVHVRDLVPDDVQLEKVGPHTFRVTEGGGVFRTDDRIRYAQGRAAFLGQRGAILHLVGRAEEISLATRIAAQEAVAARAVTWAGVPKL